MMPTTPYLVRNTMMSNTQVPTVHYLSSIAKEIRANINFSDNIFTDFYVILPSP